ncbi:hypothetical protein FRC06_005223 [Ceratobasidium sp. 370]|nr:hypothetical protein FRC06_005223 [Ceratobasidium sp. 370]
MDAPNDVCALFHSAFHPTQGNIVDFQLKVRDGEYISLDGVEFSSLPSGLHLVDQDVIHFTKDGLCGIAVFRRRRIRENGLRGVRLGAVGVLIGSAPRARPWLHLPHLKRLAAHLEATPEDWDPLTEYYESHRQPDIVPSESALEIPELWNGWEHELATASHYDVVPICARSPTRIDLYACANVGVPLELQFVSESPVGGDDDDDKRGGSDGRGRCCARR